MKYFWPTNKAGEVIGEADRLTSEQRRAIEELFDFALKAGWLMKPDARGCCYWAGWRISYHRHKEKDHITLNIMKA